MTTINVGGTTERLPGLLPHHVRELRDSGLSDETIADSGIFSESNHLKIAGLLDRKRYDRKQGCVLVFPFRDENGTTVLNRIKPDNPAKQNGKVKGKYLSPTGSTLRVYVPKSVHAKLTDPAHDLLITEGEKKALKATQESFPCVGLTGVDCWHRKKSAALLSDLDRVAWNGRNVFIVFDSDAVDNANVQTNECLLADQLKRRGANVRVVRLPGKDGQKVGLDDYLVEHGGSGFHKLKIAATEPLPPNPDDVKQAASKLDPASEAEGYLELFKRDGCLRLRFWRDAFWLWTQGHYAEIPDSEMRATVVTHLNRSYFKLTQSVVSNVIEQIKAAAILSGRREPPLWLDDVSGSEWNTSELLIARNAIVHLPSLLDGKPCQATPTPALFNTSALDFDFQSKNTEPPQRWLRFLGDLWGDDQESIDALQLWFGYLITPDTSQQKLLGLFGPKRSGKSTIARVARGLVGEKNTAAPTLTSFATNFGLWTLLGRSLAIIADARFSGRADAAAIVERLLRVTGEDAIDVDRKFLPPVSCKLPTRLMLISNELPRLSDASGALVGRMIVLRLTRSFFGCEDTRLTNDLLAELPSILWWSIQGWSRLRERGSLLQPESGAELIADLELLSSPVSVFVRECCDMTPDSRIARAELYAAYKSWCEGHGRTHVEDEAGFGRNLRAVVSTLKTVQPRVQGRRIREYVGISLLDGTSGTGGTCSY